VTSSSIYLIIGNPDIARQINEGEVKGLLVPGASRNPLVPHVPSFAESGLSPDQSAFETGSGMFAPKGDTAEIVKKLNAELLRHREEPGLCRAVS
jgi:tripartite-type tricarboxylate transporter receptor subunit TctC